MIKFIKTLFFFYVFVFIITFALSFLFGVEFDIDYETFQVILIVGVIVAIFNIGS